MSVNIKVLASRQATDFHDKAGDRSMKIYLIAFTFSIVVLGCNSNSTDDGGIVIPDAARHDAGTDAGSESGSDAGGNDAGGDGGIYCGSTRSDPNYWGRLPVSCLPRCTHETWMAASECATQECRNAALNADSTPRVIVDTVFGDLAVSCEQVNTGGHYSCIVWQNLSCDSEFCRDEYYTYWTCTADCDDELSAMVACRDSNPDWNECAVTRELECFAP